MGGVFLAGRKPWRCRDQRSKENGSSAFSATLQSKITSWGVTLKPMSRSVIALVGTVKLVAPLTGAGLVDADPLRRRAVDRLAQVHAPAVQGPVGAEHDLFPRRHGGERRDRLLGEEVGLAERHVHVDRRQRSDPGDGGLVPVETGRPIDVAHVAEVGRIGGGHLGAVGARVRPVGEQLDAGVADAGVERVAVGRDRVQHRLRDDLVGRRRSARSRAGSRCRRCDR